MLLSFTLSLGLPDGNQFRRRQAEPCATPCSWLDPISSCSSSDTACICSVFTSASALQISACVSCEQLVNATVAQAIAELDQECTSLAPAPTAPAPAAPAP